MKANLATSLIAYARGGVRKQLLVLCLLTLCVGNTWASAYLKGAWDSWANHDISGGSCEITLDANTEYEFGIDVDGSFYSYTNQNFITTSTSFQIYTGNGNCKITTGEAGTYIFKTWYDNGRYMAVYYPQARLTKQKYIYFDARNQTNWNSDNFDARFWFKYYDSGSDNGSVDCNKGNALENWVYYALVPNHDYIGQIQMNRLNPSDHDEVWCTANIAYAKDRTSSAQNCLKEESGKANYCIYWTPQWTTYCPPMSSVTMADNGTTNWGGDGSSATPYLVPTGGDIKVHVTASASALDDANMTPYFLFKKEGSAVGSGAASTEKTITASSTTGTKEAVIVEAYNYYNSTEGTHLSSGAIYYEARTPYTISYNKGTPAASISGSRESEIKLKDVTFTLPGAVFTRTGYTQTGWATSDGGAKAYELSASYTDNAALALYPVWTPKSYTVTLEGMEADGESLPIRVNVTYDAVLPSLETKHTKAHYDLLGYWAASDDKGEHLTDSLIDANGNWIPDVAGYTGNDGEGHPTWIHDGIDISLFADWTEIKHTVAIDVYPTGAGAVQVSGANITEVANVGYVTHSPVMTAVPANDAWVFKEWQVSDDTKLHLDLENYSKFDETMEITATDDGQKLTAVFEPRYYLVGGEIMSGEDGVGTGTSSGMPGWDNYNKPFEIVTNSPILATCSLTLGTNKNFYIMVRDKADGFSYGKSGGVSLGDGTSLIFENKDNRVFFYSNGGTAYTFKITGVDGSGRPTVSVERPYQVNIGRKRVDIDGNDHDDNTGGTVDLSKQTAPETWTPISNGDWVPYGISVKYNASKEDGYTLDWYTASDYATQFSTEPYWFHTATSTGNGYAKFTEKSTSVTLANDGHGKVQIGGVDKTSTTCGVTTTRELTAVPNAGYKFSSWSKSGDDITLTSSSTNPTTLSGNGSGATSGQTVTANFEERYSIKGTMNGENWGTTHTLSNIGTNAGSKDTCYVTMTLPANTTYEFAIYDEQTGGWYKAGTDAVYGMTYTNHTNWEFGDTKTYNCGITTAGKGTYKFIFNITDKTVTVVYPTSYQVNYGAAVGGSVTSVLDDDGKEIPNGGYVREGGSVTYEATANEGYTFTGWCPNDSYGDTFTNHNPWGNSNITAPSNAYAKFHSTNFVIYRTDDKASDPRAVWDDVESYEGGTISETIEFRMKVNKRDFWYTLCLPFEVNAVQVWEDGAYYDIVPYWRTDSTYYTGHYILRKPVTTTNFAIEGFEGKDRWIDPESSDVLPSKNIPYIIQWHDEYFQGKYISFFGTAGQTIPTAMDKGSYASSDETVNIYGNNSMTTGTVRDAYLLDPYYGSDGAWMREEIGTYRSVLPFECFILANPTTTAKYRVLRRDMADDTPTGLDTLFKTEDTASKVLINNRIYIIRGGNMYTLQGTLVKEVE